MSYSYLRIVHWSFWCLDIKKILALLFLFSANAQAETPNSRLFDSTTFYLGQALAHNLLDIPKKVISRDVSWDQSYCAALQFNKQYEQVPKDDDSLPFFTYGYELNLVQHSGLQDNAEVAAAYILRTPNLDLEWLRVNLGFGLGLSYALSTPNYEAQTRPAGQSSQRYQLLAFLPIELEWHVPAYQKFSLVTRIHHRSGVFGLVAPRYEGSNFFTVGLRYYF